MNTEALTELLSAIKADLTDRRLLPLVGFVVAALVAAIAYVALGVGSSSSAPAGGPSLPSSLAPGGISLSQAPGAAVVAETTDGAAAQRRGAARDPFALLPGSTPASTQSKSSSGSGSKKASPSSTASSKGESSSSHGGESKGSTPSQPSTPAPKTVYTVNLEFGIVPPGAPAETAELKSYPGLTTQTPLPSAHDREIEFVGTTVKGDVQSAIFTVDGEFILRGAATCLPSATQCTMIQLREDRSEQLESAPLATGQPVVYELRVGKIGASTASAARVRTVLRAQARAGSGLLGRRGLLALAGLHYSGQPGLLAFTDRPAGRPARPPCCQHRRRRRR
ncbi:MAG TPA: hypothetical protein VKG62_00870 [Solirubrobacteraceae bacterium]|nr:hypothetical protein [Solirubrobacteraceae bacterium]